MITLYFILALPELFISEVEGTIELQFQGETRGMLLLKLNFSVSGTLKSELAEKHKSFHKAPFMSVKY